MSPEAIISKVKSILTANSTLAAYIKAVYLGSRATNWKINFPNIIIEPVENPTGSVLQNNIKENELVLLIVGAQLVDNVEYQIVGASGFKGVMDMEIDIKAALQAYFPSLDGTCLYFQLSTAGYDVNDTGNVRAVSIEARFTYRE